MLSISNSVIFVIKVIDFEIMFTRQKLVKILIEN